MTFFKTVLAVFIGVSLAFLCEAVAYVLVQKHQDKTAKEEEKQDDKS